MQPGSPWNYPPPPPPSRTPWGIILVVAFLLLFMFGAMFAGAFFFLFRARARAPVATPTVYAPPPTPFPTPTLTATATTTAPPAPLAAVRVVPVGGSPVRGKNDALVTVVEFSDFQCPYCKRVETTLTTFRGMYGDDLRIVWKNVPLAFHPHAQPAAEVALEARAERGDATFWAVHDDIYAASPMGIDDASLARIASAHGVSSTSASSAITTDRYKAMIDADKALASRVGANGTPTFFVNGRILVGAQPLEKFQALIDQELKAAKARVAKGTPRARVYDEIMASATE